jgi:Amt family ammonium transporter
MMAIPAMAQDTGTIDTGDTAWVLVSAALVMLMTPAVGLFYGGMVRKKNVLSILMQSFIILALISIQWVLFGYSLTFSPDTGYGFIWGALATGLFASAAINSVGVDGLIYGNAGLVLIQIEAIVAVLVYSIGMTVIILKILDAAMGLRVKDEHEVQRLDVSQHGEKAYV